MKLRKNQRGSAHFIAVFAVLFAVVGFVGLAVSQAATKHRSSNGGIKGVAVIVNCEESKAEKNCKQPYANAQGIIAKYSPPVDCNDSTKPCPSIPNPPQSSPSIFTTDEKGRFKVELPQGEYSVSLSSSPKSDINCDSQVVSVPSKKYADVKLTCSPGSSTEPQTSGIDGTVVQLYMPPCPDNLACAQVLQEKPYANAAGTVSARYGCFPSEDGSPALCIDPPPDGGFKAVFKTDEAGKFKVDVPSGGKYIVKVTDSNSPKCPEQIVEVFAQKRASTKIVCE